jgi:hypothetical protein
MILLWQKHANRLGWLTDERSEARWQAGIERLLGGLVVGDDLCCCGLPPVAPLECVAFNRAILAFFV